MRRNTMFVLGLVAAFAASCKSTDLDPSSDVGSSSGASSSGEPGWPEGPFTVAEGLKDPSSIVADDIFIYWSNRGTNVNNEYPKHDGSIVKLAQLGGSPVVLVTDTNVDTLALDDEYVYWIDNDTIRRVPKAGGEPGVVAVDADSPQWLAVDANDVYWTTNESTVVKVSKQGGPSTTLVPPTDSLNFRRIAVDTTDVYCIDYGKGKSPFMDGGLWKVAKSGGPMTNVVSGLAAPWAVAVDHEAVYWSNTGNTSPPTNEPTGAIFKISKSGGAPVLLVDGQRTVYDIARVDGTLFWGNYTSGPVLSVDPQSGVSTSLAPSESASSVAVGPSFVYWVEPIRDDGGRIRAVVR